MGLSSTITSLECRSGRSTIRRATITRRPSWTCGAAKPIPSAAAIVSIISSMSCWSPESPELSTSIAGLIRTGWPRRAIVRMVIPLNSAGQVPSPVPGHPWRGHNLVLSPAQFLARGTAPCRPFFALEGVKVIVEVQVRDNNVDQALRALKKKMQREGLYREMRMRRHYEKPSERRAREKAEAVRRYRKLLRKRAERDEI